VVERFAQLKEAGCDGVQPAFFDFAADLEFFGQEIVPLMIKAGPRVR
jgi:FMNH2-dependent dimethyl sulfone monooxygenase